MLDCVSGINVKLKLMHFVITCIFSKIICHQHVLFILIHLCYYLIGLKYMLKFMLKFKFFLRCIQ